MSPAPNDASTTGMYTIKIHLCFQLRSFVITSIPSKAMNNNKVIDTVNVRLIAIPARKRSIAPTPADMNNV